MKVVAFFANWLRTNRSVGADERRHSVYKTRKKRDETKQRQAEVLRQDLRGTKAVALLLYMRARGIGRAAKAAREHGEQAGGSSGAGLGQEGRPDRSASERMEAQ